MQRKRNNIIKWTIYVLILTAVYILQTSYDLSIVFFGVKLDVIPYLTTAVAMYEKTEPAVAFWCLAGILEDAASTSMDGCMLLLYGFAGIASVLLTRMVFKRAMLSDMIIGTGFLALQSVISYVFCFAPALLWEGLLIGAAASAAKLILSAAISPALYFLIKYIHKKYSSHFSA